MTCDTCGAWPGNHCHALDGQPLAMPHAGRNETTPIHDSITIRPTAEVA